jgi:hypothetical protein
MEGRQMTKGCLAVRPIRRRGINDVLRPFFSVFAFCMAALVMVCRASATAATEFCPARLTNIGTKSSGGDLHKLLASREVFVPRRRIA